MDADATVGVVGVGHMGSVILEQLLPHVGQALVCDLDPAARKRAEAMGAVAVEDPIDLARRASYVLSVLPRDEHVESVAFAPNGLLAAGDAAFCWIEMSTIDPATTRRLGEAARGTGVVVADAGIVGRFGALSFLVGGEMSSYERTRALLEHIGTTYHCGPLGAGVTAKIVNNMLAGTIFGAVCEALVLGLKAGLPLELLLEVLSKTAADNAALRGSIPIKVAERDFEPGFLMTLMQKDALLAVDLAQRHQVPLRVASVVNALRQDAIARGMGSLDATALARLMEEETDCAITWSRERTEAGRK